MTDQYIIKFSNNDSDPIDGLAEIYKTNYDVPILNVKTCENNLLLLSQIITNSISELNFNDTTMEFTINTSKITFDKNSSSAYSQFKKLIINMINTKFETEYYPSGNIFYVGEVLTKNGNKRVPDGQGFMYYDSPDLKLKYSGQFEDGSFDGAGVFYNKTGNINLKANNISKNIPTQKGKLDVKFKNKKETFDFDFFDIWDDLNVLDDKAIIELVMSDDFIDRLTDFFADLDEESEESFEEFKFELKSTDEKLCEIRSQLQEIKSDIDTKYNDISKSASNNNLNIILLQVLVCILISIIVHIY